MGVPKEWEGRQTGSFSNLSGEFSGRLPARRWWIPNAFRVPFFRTRPFSKFERPERTNTSVRQPKSPTLLHFILWWALPGSVSIHRILIRCLALVEFASISYRPVVCCFSLIKNTNPVKEKKSYTNKLASNRNTQRKSTQTVLFRSGKKDFLFFPRKKIVDSRE